MEGYIGTILILQNLSNPDSGPGHDTVNEEWVQLVCKCRGLRVGDLGRCRVHLQLHHDP